MLKINIEISMIFVYVLLVLFFVIFAKIDFRIECISVAFAASLNNDCSIVKISVGFTAFMNIVFEIDQIPLVLTKRWHGTMFCFGFRSGFGIGFVGLETVSGVLGRWRYC